jgi:hypothetical protein
MKKGILLISIIMVFTMLTGCSVQSATGPGAEMMQSVNSEITAENNGLDLVADGSWRTFLGASGISGYYNVNAWVDIKVPNYSYEKTVGIVWTDDAWATTRVAYASYEFTNGDGSEQWGVDIAPIGSIEIHRSMGPVYWTNIDGDRWHLGYPHVPVFLDYAIFYDLPGGETIWDNNNGQNYRLTLVE